MKSAMSSNVQAFLRSPHDVKAAQFMVEPSVGENGFGCLSIQSGSGCHDVSLSTDDPALLRDVARKAVALANRVEAMNRLHAEVKKIPADDDVLAALELAAL